MSALVVQPLGPMGQVTARAMGLLLVMHQNDVIPRAYCDLADDIVEQYRNAEVDGRAAIEKEMT